jgi:hypothetical protein
MAHSTVNTATTCSLELGACPQSARLPAPDHTHHVLPSWRSLDQLFTESFSRQNQLIRADPSSSTYLATALVLRGAVAISDINRNLARIKPSMRTVRWNSEVRAAAAGTLRHVLPLAALHLPL